MTVDYTCTMTVHLHDDGRLYICTMTVTIHLHDVDYTSLTVDYTPAR